MASVRKSEFFRRKPQRGYILLTLMLFFTLLAITAVAIAPNVIFELRRDREEELIHRGVQYSRATRRYFKKFGRYPTRIEDLENTNNIRFLRRRYKDPITGKDFKLLHIGEVQLAMGRGIAGATSIGQPIGTGPAGTTLGPSGPGGRRADSGMPASLQPTSQQPNAPPDGQTDAGSNSASSSSSTKSDSTNSASSTGTSGGGDKLAAQVFGGGPIVGVASTSKDETIREFNKKNHYNDWQFIYDPGTDRGGLITTPAQPALAGSIAIPQPVAPAVTGGFGSISGGISSPQGQPTSAQPPPGMQPQSPPQQ